LLKFQVADNGSPGKNSYPRSPKYEALRNVYTAQYFNIQKNILFIKRVNSLL